MSRNSQFNETRQFKWPKPKRGAIVKSDSSERGLFARCPNCGFINNMRRISQTDRSNVITNEPQSGCAFCGYPTIR